MNMYQDNNRYTDEAMVFTNRIHAAIQPIFDEYITQGASPRELANLIHGVAVDVECVSVITQSMKQRKNHGKESQG